jgi:hypothetical protein
MPDLFYQTCPEPYPADVNAFADALEEIMVDGTHDLDAIAAALNARRVTTGGHDVAWTPGTLAVYLAELANA